MSYEFFLDGIRLPVTPSKLTVRSGSLNKTIVLIGNGEINLLNKPGLLEFSFTALLPNSPYPFARYDGGFRDAYSFLADFSRLKNLTGFNGLPAPFQFVVSRVSPNGKLLFDNDVRVSLENYSILENADSGNDVSVEINLRQYREYGTKIVAYSESSNLSAETVRPAESAPVVKYYTVVKGDSLWTIAKKFLGDGSRYLEIYNLNKTTIDSRNKGTGLPKYTIYPNQSLALP